MANHHFRRKRTREIRLEGAWSAAATGRPAFASVARAGSPASASGEELSRGGQGPEAPNELSLTAL